MSCVHRSPGRKRKELKIGTVGDSIIADLSILIFWGALEWIQHSYLYLTGVLCHPLRIFHLAFRPIKSWTHCYPAHTRYEGAHSDVLWSDFSPSIYFWIRKAITVLTKESLHIMHLLMNHIQKQLMKFLFRNARENMHSLLMNLATDACLRWSSGIKIYVPKVEIRDTTKRFHRQRSIQLSTNKGTKRVSIKIFSFTAQMKIRVLTKKRQQKTWQLLLAPKHFRCSNAHQKIWTLFLDLLEVLSHRYNT